jgi:hypothetical protein
MTMKKFLGGVYFFGGGAMIYIMAITEDIFLAHVSPLVVGSLWFIATCAFVAGFTLVLSSRR